jgi:outer membrane receptor protein involved in Fe transport
MNHAIRHFAGLLLGSVIAFSAAGAYAQDDSGVFEEILVTAQKRQQTLQDVPISVAVIGGERLDEIGIDNLDDLAPYVPNFSKGESGAAAIIRIRGIATGSNPAFEQSVVTYLDDVSMSRSPLARMPFMDLERVEVLRGPQNVLFGKNAIAGAISMVSAKPTDEFEGNFSLRYEPDFEDLQATAVLSGPMSDSLRGRLAVRYADYGGYFEKYSNETGNDQEFIRDEEQREELSIRGTLATDIGDDGELIFKIEHATADSVGQSHDLVFAYGNPFPLSPANPLAGLNYFQSVAAIQAGYNAAIGGFGLPPVDVGTDIVDEDRIRRSAFDGFQDVDISIVELTFNQQYEGFTFTSVTGYIEYTEDRLAGGGLSGVDISSILTREEYDQISQEIRITSDLGGAIDWIGGVYLQAWNLEAVEHTLLDDMNMPVLLGVAGLAPGLEAVANIDGTRTYTGKSTTYAAFGQLTWNISDAARVSLGGRYTYEDKRGRRTFDIINSQTGLFDPTQAIFASCAFGVDYQPLGELSAFVPLPDCNGVVGFGVYSTHDAIGQRSEDSFTPSLTLEFDVGDNSMIYAAGSTGFKAGGFDALAPREDELEFEDETVTGYEIGWKSRFAGGKAETNFALFHSTYEDLQVSTFDGTASFVVGNAAEFLAQGVEFDGRWRITDSLSLTGSLAWTDTEWKKYDNATCNALYSLLTGETVCDRTGLEASNTPEWSGNLIIDFNVPIGNSLYFRATADAIYESEYFTESTKEIGTKQDAYTKYNARLALEGEKWSFSILGKNLTDETVIQFSSQVPLSGSLLAAPAYYGYFHPPRTVSAQFDYRF